MTEVKLSGRVSSFYKSTFLQLHMTQCLIYDSSDVIWFHLSDCYNREIPEKSSQGPPTAAQVTHCLHPVMPFLPSWPAFPQNYLFPFNLRVGRKDDFSAFAHQPQPHKFLSMVHRHQREKWLPRWTVQRESDRPRHWSHVSS